MWMFSSVRRPKVQHQQLRVFRRLQVGFKGDLAHDAGGGEDAALPLGHSEYRHLPALLRQKVGPESPGPDCHQAQTVPAGEDQGPLGEAEQPGVLLHQPPLLVGEGVPVGEGKEKGTVHGKRLLCRIGGVFLHFIRSEGRWQGQESGGPAG